MSAGCPLCGDAHTLDHCPRWRAKAMPGISSAMSHLAIYGECMMRSEADGTVRHVPKSEYAQPEQAKPTDLSKRLRDVVQELRRTPKPIADVIPMLQQAADEIERYYGGMLAWKATAEAKDPPAQQQPVAVPARELTDACAWTLDDDESGTWASKCGELWSFIDGGPKENNVRFCHGCGKPVHLTAPRGESDKTVGDGA